MAILFQIGCLASFLQGTYESPITYDEIRKQGDIGLGTFNAVDGEMVAIDGEIYRIDVHGVAKPITSDSHTPFALLCPFQKVESFEIRDIGSLQELSAVLDKHIQSANFFQMIRIDGDFFHVDLRSESCQLKPYKSLVETLPKLQKSFSVGPSSGSLIVTRCPDYMSALTIPGYHYHYIDAQRKTGGHVYNLKVDKANVQINELDQFQMRLFHSPTFDHTTINPNGWQAFENQE